MSDKLTPEKRSWNMSRIKNKDTVIEICARKWLFAHGYRYRKNVKSLPGHPDIVLSKYKTVIFVHGCFWHRHEGCKDATMPKTRIDFWTTKLAKNHVNDVLHQARLEQLGWRVYVLWECELNRNLEETMNRAKKFIEK